MEAPGPVGGQPAEAEAAAAGSGPAGGAEELDLSLDDIIKRNRQGQTNARLNRWRQPLKNRSAAYSNRRPRFRNWAPRNLQGPNRFQGGFRKQPYFRMPFWNGRTRPRQRAAIGPKGLSPLNRPASAQQGQAAETTLAGGSDGATAETQEGQPTGAKRFRAAGAPLPGRRPFRLNRRPAFLQRQSRFNFNRGQKKPNSERQQPRMRRWQAQPDWGAVLTISVSNPQASQTNLPGTKRPFPRGRSTPTRRSLRQPKGVPLRFNFRAMANQTSLTLNERFSGLRNQRYFTAARNAGRMVTLP